MKRFLTQFILFYYEKYVKEDVSDLTKLGRVCLALPILYKSIFMWAICFITLPEFLLSKNKVYQKFLRLKTKNNL